MSSGETVLYSPPPGRPLGLWLVLAAAAFAAVAPTLAWLEFAHTPENLVVETALEIRRGGTARDWLLPTLDGVPRTKKPPLAAWVTAAAVRPSTLAAIASTDPAARAAGYRALAWDARWPALLASCLTLLGAAELGFTLGGPRLGRALGTLTLLACGSTFLFLRFGRLASADVYLSLFVAWTNVFLAKAVFDRRRWLGCCGAGLAAGLALMSKGPVCLAQSVAPLAVFLVWRAARARRAGGPRATGAGAPVPAGPPAGHPWKAGDWAAPVLVGVLLLFVIDVPWLLAALRNNPNQWDVWMKDLGGGDAPSPVYAYLPLLATLFLPWVLFGAAGAVEAVRAATGRPAGPGWGLDAPWLNGRAARPGLVYALFLLLVPVLIQTCFKSRQDRYLQPLAPAQAVLAAWGLLATAAVLCRPRRAAPSGPEAPQTLNPRRLNLALAAGHWLLLGLVALGVPLAGYFSKSVRTADGRMWFPAPLAFTAAGVLLALVLAGAYFQRRRPAGSVALTTFVVMGLAQALFVHGYGSAPGGRSSLRPLAEEIRAAWPDALMYSAHPEPGKRLAVDLSIYLNRPIRWVAAADVDTLPHGDRPRVVVYVQRPEKGDAPPNPPAGWELYKVVAKGTDRWHLFVSKGRENSNDEIRNSNQIPITKFQ